jgi:hypothetical protein
MQVRIGKRQVVVVVGVVGVLMVYTLCMCEDDDLQQLLSYPTPADGPIWCVVANVMIDRPAGPGGAEIRHGTKHFAPGAKVYVLELHYERVRVFGRHRKSNRYVSMMMNPKNLANWRPELEYSPHIIAQIQASDVYLHYTGTRDNFRTRVEEIVQTYLSLGAITQPYVTRTSPNETDCTDGTSPDDEQS